MYLERMVFRAKPGQVRPLVKLFKEFRDALPAEQKRNMHLFTDVTGDNWTFVLERDVKSLDEMVAADMPPGIPEELMEKLGKYHEHVEVGRREVYRYED